MLDHVSCRMDSHQTLISDTNYTSLLSAVITLGLHNYSETHRISACLGAASHVPRTSHRPSQEGAPCRCLSLPLLVSQSFFRFSICSICLSSSFFFSSGNKSGNSNVSVAGCKPHATRGKKDKEIKMATENFHSLHDKKKKEKDFYIHMI